MESQHLLVTGGAGFIGRWVVAELLRRERRVTVLDNLSSGRRSNLGALTDAPDFVALRVADVRDAAAVAAAFDDPSIDGCVHLAAEINVQRSIDQPRLTFDTDVRGSFELLEHCRRRDIPYTFMSSCMVYDRAPSSGPGLHESSPVCARSPYAAAKLAAEQLTLSYGHAYGLPVSVLRPFNTYGPYQRPDGEGGVVSIFAERARLGESLNIYGDGTQTRDLLYVEDCARFVCDAALSPAARGRVLNAGTGRDVDINALAALVCPDVARHRHVEHIHPQSEIPRLRCDAGEAQRLLGWRPRVSLEEGIARTLDWLQTGGFQLPRRQAA